MSDNKFILEALFESVDSNTRNGRVSWKDVVEDMSGYAKGKENTREKWRSMYRVHKDSKYKKQRHQAIARRDDKRVDRFGLKSRLLGSIKKERSLTFLIDRLGYSKEEIQVSLLELISEGYNIVSFNFEGDTYYRLNKTLPNSVEDFRNFYDTKEIKIGLVSDTHFGSNNECLKELEEFYTYANSLGVVDFYHSGDITDGWYTNRSDQVYELHKFGFEQQMRHVVDKYPSIDGVTTYFITGNHDTTHIRNGGANLGKTISAYRDDMVYLGHEFAKVWLTPELDLNLIHPRDGSAYSVSLKSQKIVDNAEGKRKSKIMAIGHYHKMNFINWKGTHAITMPSFQSQTSFMKGNNLKSYVGGIILHIKVDNDGNLISLLPEFVDFTDFTLE